MAIIYTYPLNSIIRSEDILIGTSTRIVDGQKKNITKNFSIGDLTDFVRVNVSLDDVLAVNNVSTRDAKIGSLYLYDTPLLDYGNITLSQNAYAFYSVAYGEVFRMRKGLFRALSTDGYKGNFILTGLTQDRSWEMPNKDGVVAMTSDIPNLSGYVPATRTLTINGVTYDLSEDRVWNITYQAPTLQEVTTEGNLTTNEFYKVDNIENPTRGIGFTPEDHLSLSKTIGDNFKEVILNQNDITESYTLKLPNKPSGDYVVATTDDISSVEWGDIAGDILNQEDLITYIEDNYYPLDSNPAGYLTQDQVEEYTDLASFPPVGVIGTIYIALNTGLFYTWNGSTYILSAAPDTGITGGGIINRLPKFTPNGTTLGSSNFSDDGLNGRYTIGTSYVSLMTGGNTFLRLHRASNNRMEFGLGASGIGQAADITTNNALGLEIIATGASAYVSLKAGASATEGLRVLSSGKLQFTQAPDTGTTSDFILLRDSSGNVKQIAYPTIPSVSGYVPYTGATQNVDLGEFELKAGQLTLDVSPTGTAAVGTTRWNDSIGSSETTLKGGNVLLKNGVDLVARVVNKVTPNATLLRTNYQAVRVSGAQGQRLAVAYAQANNDNNSADTIGLVCEDIATNQEGFIMTVGQLENINTTGSLQGETWADGDVLYLSPTTPGSLTNIKPSAPGHIVVIGYVEYAHAINGKLYVKIMNGWELDELHNVKITSPQNNDVLMYDNTDTLWENKNPFDYFDAKPIVNQKHVSIPTFGASAINNVEGVAYVLAGATSRSWSDTNSVTRGQRVGVITSTTGNLAQIRQTQVYLSRNGGFDTTTCFNMAENAGDTAIRFFIGHATNTGVFTNVEPNTLLNVVGICRLSTSNNLHVIHNDNSGTATTIDLGSNFPANTDSLDKYCLIIKTVSTGVYIQIDRIGTASSYSTTLTTDIPSGSTGLNFGAYIVDTTGASVNTGFDWYGTYIKV